MYGTLLPFPVLAGKTEADIRSVADRFTADPEGYFESRHRAGVIVERAYWQHIPMGDFVVACAESERSTADVIGTYTEQATDIDRFFAARSSAPCSRRSSTSTSRSRASSRSSTRTGCPIAADS